MNPRRISLAGVVLASVLAAAGCGPSGPTTIPIRGEVIFQGKPLRDVPFGLVHYLPKTAEGRQATGRLQPDGTFELTTFKNADGVVPGEYDVVVAAYSGQTEMTREQVEASAGAGIPKARQLIPEKYSQPTTSGISDTVNSDHSGFKRIELTDE
jgi:hypothetical protein